MPLALRYAQRDQSGKDEVTGRRPVGGTRFVGFQTSLGEVRDFEGQVRVRQATGSGGF